MNSPRGFYCFAVHSFAIYCFAIESFALLTASPQIVARGRIAPELKQEFPRALLPQLQMPGAAGKPANGQTTLLRQSVVLLQTSPAADRPTKKPVGKAVAPPKPTGKAAPPAAIKPGTQKPASLPGFSPSGASPGTTALPPPILPPVALHRIALTPEPIAATGSRKPCRLEIDVRNVQGGWGQVWSGISLDPAVTLPAGSGSDRIPKAFPANGARYVRFDPFSIAGSVTLALDGTPIVSWEAGDALLQALHQKGAGVILSLAPPLPMTDAAWQSLVKATAVRYGKNPEFGVVRWELAGRVGVAPQRLSGFAAAIHAIAPKAPIGILLSSGEIIAGTQQTVALCTALHIPLSSFGWRSPAASAPAHELLQNVRRAFAAQPALRRCVLLPEVDTSALSPAAAVGLAVRLAASNTPDGPNPLAGILTQQTSGTSAIRASIPSSLPFSASPATSTSLAAPASSSAPLSKSPPSNSMLAVKESSAARLTPDLAGLMLLNRAAGNRLRAAGEMDDVRCLAVLGIDGKQDGSRKINPQGNVTLKNAGQGALSLLIWRDSATDAPSTLPVLIHLTGMAKNGIAKGDIAKDDIAKNGIVKNAPGGLRLTRFDLRTDEKVSASEIDRPAATLDIPGGIASGEFELEVSLRHGGVTLLRLEDHSPPPLEIELTPSAGSTHTYVGGTTFDIIAVIHNPTKQTLPLDLALSSSPSGIVPEAMSLLAPGNIASNGSRALSIQLHAPPLAIDRDAFVTLKAGGETCAVYALRLRTPVKTELLTPRIDLSAPGKPGAARLRFTNYGKTPLTFSATTAAGTKNETVVKLIVPVPTPQQKVTVRELTIRTAEADASLYPVDLQLEGTGAFKGIVQQFHVQIGVPLLCHRAHLKESANKESAKPEFTGELAAWTDAIPLGMGRGEQTHGKTWGGVGDLSAAAYTKWDDRYFYFACDVTDDLFDPPPIAAKMRDADSVQFAVSPLPTTVKQDITKIDAKMARLQGSGNAIRTIRAQQFGITQLADGRVALMRFVGAAGAAQPVPGALVAVHRSGTRTLYEAAIPWQQLAPFVAKEGTAFGISVLVNDRDGAAIGSIEWGGGMTAGDIDISRFPPLRLVR